MSDIKLRILLDQNIPVPVLDWFRKNRPLWTINHVTELGFAGKEDAFLYRWAQAANAIIVTYDEDFADARMYPLGQHHGVIRLRVWPTTIEQTEKALLRLMNEIPEAEWIRSLIIINNSAIRLRHL
jgi:predicted nuclease of predicted toxin-antitoxin system